MRGQMMDRPLLISSLIEHAALYHREIEVVSRTVEGPIHRYTYLEVEQRSKQLANALAGLGIELGDWVATVAWNGFRHVELYFAISGMGAVCHTINPRLHPDQLSYIVNHAEDKVLFLDLTFVPLLEAVAAQLPTVTTYVVMTDRQHMPDTSLPGALCYEELLAAASPDFDWPQFDESTASSLCYTSGTTGNPKGVLYSHRSTVLHSLAACQVDTLGISSQDVILPVVPMFHVNAWGLPYACAMSGAKMVMPGALLDGGSVWELLDSEKVTMTAGVPTVWLMLLNYMREQGLGLETVGRVVIGGSAASESMIAAFQEEFGCQVIHAWGMTETSPLGTIGTLKSKHRHLSAQERLALQLKQGRGLYGVEMRIVDEDGDEQPRDGKAFGELQVRGPWVVGDYFRHQGSSTLTADGWFATGDVSTLDPDGFMQITDRAKDVIKSGGEWISSIDLENEAAAHPKVAEAAVIGVPHPKWSERPILVVVPVKGDPPSKEELLDFLDGRVAKWWLPDDMVLVDELPHTATGKVSKRTLRRQLADYRLPDAD